MSPWRPVVDQRVFPSWLAISTLRPNISYPFWILGSIPQSQRGASCVMTCAWYLVTAMRQLSKSKQSCTPVSSTNPSITDPDPFPALSVENENDRIREPKRVSTHPFSPDWDTETSRPLETLKPFVSLCAPSFFSISWPKGTDDAHQQPFSGLAKCR
jgi:hypothetical protein